MDARRSSLPLGRECPRPGSEWVVFNAIAEHFAYGWRYTTRTNQVQRSFEDTSLKQRALELVMAAELSEYTGTERSDVGYCVPSDDLTHSPYAFQFFRHNTGRRCESWGRHIHAALYGESMLNFVPTLAFGREDTATRQLHL
jgi:hypothetical protein